MSCPHCLSTSTSKRKQRVLSELRTSFDREPDKNRTLGFDYVYAALLGIENLALTEPPVPNPDGRML